MNRVCQLILLLVLLSTTALAQDSATAASTYDWAKVTTTGQVGPYLDQVFTSAVAPSVFTISWSVSGTAPTGCTFRVEGSADKTNWFGLDATAPAVDSLPCTSSNMVSIVNRPTRYVRVYVVAYTAGDSTTSVVFGYTKGQ